MARLALVVGAGDISYQQFGDVGCITRRYTAIPGQEPGSIAGHQHFLLFFYSSGSQWDHAVKAGRRWPLSHLLRLMTLTVFASLALLTARAAYQSSYINYDDANELLVYAHSAGGVKEVMSQVEAISRRTADGLGLRRF